MMAAKNQNFLRLWVIDSPYGYHLDGTRGAITPVPFQRPGPGNAADGGLKFNLSQLNQSFFDQLRARVIEAGSKGDIRQRDAQLPALHEQHIELALFDVQHSE